MDVDSNEVLLRGLSMPHSPRWYREKLWVLESGEGSLAVVDLERRTWQTVAQVPGFTRGVDFIGPLAFIGLSQVRESAVFSGIPLVQRLKERTCGVWVVNIETGQTVGFLRFESGVQEIFAVQILRGSCFPELLEWSDPRLAQSYVLPDEALQDVFLPTEKDLARSPAFHFQRGNDLYKKGKLEEAIADFEQCVALQPEFPNAQYHLGVALGDTEHYQEAAVYLEQVVQAEPEKARRRGKGRRTKACGRLPLRRSLLHRLPAGHHRLQHAHGLYGLGVSDRRFRLCIGFALSAARLGNRLSRDKLREHRQKEKRKTASQCQPAEPGVQQEDCRKEDRRPGRVKDRENCRAGDEVPELLEVARTIASAKGLSLAGVLTHAGHSYARRGESAIAAVAEEERAGAVRAAERLRAAGLSCPVVSVGATPTAMFARSLEGVTEMRPGVYTLMDLYQMAIGVCRREDIAASVLATVIGHNPRTGRILIDAGALALSQDKGAASLMEHVGFGWVCAEKGERLDGLYVAEVNQEHGMIASAKGAPPFERLPVGTRLRILPSHACMTAAPYAAYHVLDGGDEVVAMWDKATGW